MMPLAAKKGIALEVEIDQRAGLFNGDQKRVEQVMLNLLSNAIKFTETGRVSLTCGSGENHVFISVSDTGIGIAEENIDEIFKPFHQIDNGITRKHEGTGLGLPITKKLVMMMKGDIRVASKPGTGSTFTVILPAEKGDSV
jgi:signal transduction histidine kinase